MRSLLAVLGVVLFGAGVIVGSMASNPATTRSVPTQATPAPSRVPRSATVSDYSVPVDLSEADAMRPRGFAGQGTLGRFGGGCEVSVLKLTDRAAQVQLVRCPESDTITSPPELKRSSSLPVWVARSALTLR